MEAPAGFAASVGSGCGTPGGALASEKKTKLGDIGGWGTFCLFFCFVCLFCFSFLYLVVSYFSGLG